MQCFRFRDQPQFLTAVSATATFGTLRGLTVLLSKSELIRRGPTIDLASQLAVGWKAAERNCNFVGTLLLQTFDGLETRSHQTNSIRRTNGAVRPNAASLRQDRPGSGSCRTVHMQDQRTAKHSLQLQ